MTPTVADVTVVIPARDAASTIAATLRSIRDQSAGAPTVVVVDDGSSDDTAAVAAAAGCAVVHLPGHGPGAARNAGLRSVRTDLVAFCDADDRWPPDRLASDLTVLATRPDLDVLLCRTRFDADEPGLLDGLDLGDDGAALIPHFGAATVRRSVFDRTGPIAEGISNYEDYDWFLRVREIGAQVVTLDRIGLWRRMHHTSTSRSNPPRPNDLLGVLRASVVRRRAAGTDAPLPRLADLRRDGDTA